MKYLNKIFLLLLLVCVFASCKKELTTEEKVTIDEGWTITAIQTNYTDIVLEIENNNLDETGLVAGLLEVLKAEMETIQDCENDDVIKFVSGGAFNYNDGSKVCDANSGVFLTQNELFFEDGTWSLKDDNTLTITTVFEGETDAIDYTIETLTDDRFVLFSSIDANTETEIEEGTYQFNNNVELRLTMTKAN